MIVWDTWLFYWESFVIFSARISLLLSFVSTSTSVLIQVSKNQRMSWYVNSYKLDMIFSLKYLKLRMSYYVMIVLFNTTIFIENPIAMNYDRYGEESSRKNWCDSKEEFESCLSSCYRYISWMEKGNVNCPSMCINACNTSIYEQMHCKIIHRHISEERTKVCNQIIGRRIQCHGTETNFNRKIYQSIKLTGGIKIVELRTEIYRCIKIISSIESITQSIRNFSVILFVTYSCHFSLD